MPVTGIRIDKWLWAARFYKTRSLASRACEFGRFECNGQSVKPSRDIRAGDMLEIKNDSGIFKSKSSRSAKCVDLRRSPRCFTARPMPAANCA